MQPHWNNPFCEFLWFLCELRKDDCLVLVGEYFALYVLRYRTGEDNLLEVSALEDQTLGGVFVGDACHVLLDDGTSVQLHRHIMAGGAYDLDSTLVGLMVRFCANERGEEGVVDIDDMMRVFCYHLIGYDLHIAGQYDEGYLLAVEKFQFSCLHL